MLGAEIAPLVNPDHDDPKAVRFDALMYGIELAYLAGKTYTRARNDLLQKAGAIAGVSNIPAIMAQSELLEEILPSGSALYGSGRHRGYFHRHEYLAGHPRGDRQNQLKCYCGSVKEE